MIPRSIRLENYLLDDLPGDETLWITFDHAGLPKHPAEKRLGWAVPELCRHGWSVLAIKARAADWFLKPDLAAFFRSPEFKKITEGKKRIILYGLSMGGFGAFVYSSIIDGSVVLAISPQTTLDPAKVPWEKRFGYALGEDWTGPFGDVNGLTPAHAEAYVVYCPANKFDGPHMERLDRFGPITHLPLIGNAHVPGGMLMESGLLKEIVHAVGAGPMSADFFDEKQEMFEKSASYHYFIGCNTEDPVARGEAMTRCLERASSRRTEFYRQRIAGFMMRAAAKADDRIDALRHYKELRRCAAWRGSVTLKLMAARYLLRVQAVDVARELLAEIAKRHPEGHRKLADLHRRFDEVALEVDRLSDANAAAAETKKVANG